MKVELKTIEVTEKPARKIFPSVSYAPIDISKAKLELGFKPTSLVRLIICN